MTTTLVIGQPAPDFELVNHHGEKVTLSSFQGKQNVVLVFYPFAFSGTCTGELCALRDDISAFQNDDVQVLGIACDPMYSARAFAEAEGYTFPILADFWPHGEVSKRYGVFFEERGFSTRGTFIIDKAGILRWQVVNGPGEARNAADYKAALASVASSSFSSSIRDLMPSTRNITSSSTSSSSARRAFSETTSC